MSYTLLDDESSSGRYTLLPDETRSVTEQLSRGTGLGTRATIKGLLGLPLAALEGGIQIGNLVNRGLSGITGAAQMPGAFELTDRALDALGIAKPETPAERVASDVMAGATGSGGTAVAASKLAPAFSRSSGAVVQTLGKEPGVQALAGASAGVGGGVAREAGADPFTQLAASLLAGSITPAAYVSSVEAAKAGWRAKNQLLKPFSESGRETVVGNTLQRMSTNPKEATANMANAPEFVPGSSPTTGQASRDLGLLQTERALASTDSRFAARKSASNAARNVALDEIAQTPEALKAAGVARQTQGNADYAAAFSTPLRSDAPLDPLLELTKRPAFQAAIKKAQTIAAESGDDKLDILLDPKGLHYVKLALDDMIDTAPQAAIGKAQQRAIAQTRTDFLTWLEDASPAYAKAKANYAEASKPINQMEIGQEIQQRTRLAGPDVTGEPIISQAKWHNVVTNKIEELGKTLTPKQIENLQAIGNDLDRAILSDTAGKAAGSNTFQNLSAANVIGAALGGKMATNSVAQTLMRPLQWVYKYPEQQVKDLLVEAMLDPKLASVLMGKASPVSMDLLSQLLKDKARAIGFGVMTTEAGQSGRR